MVDRFLYTCGPQGLHFAGKQELFTIKKIVERLFTKAIPCNKKGLFLFIPDSKGKHPIKLLEAFNIPTIVCCHNNLRIGMRKECITLLPQVFLQLKVIVNFTIVSNAVARSCLWPSFIQVIGS